MNRFNQNLPETPFDPETAVSIGRITSVHGIKGEVKVQPLTDFENRFNNGAKLYVDARQVVIQGSRQANESVILKLIGIDDRTAAEALRGKELQVQQAQPIYEKGRYFIHDLIGLDVVDDAGETLGQLQDVMSTGANDVYIVKGERGELLLPAIEDVVKDIDLAARRITVSLMPGLDFLVQRPPRPKRVPHRPPSPKKALAGAEPTPEEPHEAADAPEDDEADDEE